MSQKPQHPFIHATITDYSDESATRPAWWLRMITEHLGDPRPITSPHLFVDGEEVKDMDKRFGPGEYDCHSFGKYARIAIRQGAPT